MTKVTLFGAGGNMGMRITNALRNAPAIELKYVDPAEAGKARLQNIGLTTDTQEAGCSWAEVAIFAVPDNIVSEVAEDLVPRFSPGTLLMFLDPAAPYAEIIPIREDLSYFVCHPAHPPVFSDELDRDARKDYFGSGLARQSIVCALMQGTEADYATGENIAAKMFGPVLRSHRITVEQMAILEPALSETTAGTLLYAIKEGMDRAVTMGVPEEAARDFILGHINISLAIFFGEIDWRPSDGAMKAMEAARSVIFKEDWMRVFDIENIKTSVRRITGTDE